MARFTLTVCFLLTIAASNLGMICAMEAPQTNADHFPTSTGGVPTGTDNRGDFGAEDVGTSHMGEMSQMLESHLLRMLKLSARPPAGIADATVPSYVRALQLAIDSLPPSAATLDGSDHLTWAVKALRGICLKFLQFIV